MSLWDPALSLSLSKTQNEREKLLADAKEAAERNAEGEDDEDGKREEGLYSSTWVSAVQQVYVCTRMCAYARARVCVFKLTPVGSVYVLCIV